MKRLLLFILVVLVPVVVTAGIKSSMTGIGAGARGGALHGSFAGVANDYTAGFWNPAGMGFIRQTNFGAMLYRLPINRNVSYLGLVLPVSEYDRIGVSWLGCAIGGLEAREGNSEYPNYLFDSNDQAFQASYARLLWDRLGVGLSARLLYHSLDAAIGIGYSIDLGVLYQATERAKVGLALYDVSSKLHWQTGQNDVLEKTISLAGSYQLDNLLLALGIESNYAKQPELRLSCGAEFEAMNLLLVRTGYYDNKLAIGLGVKFRWQNINTTVNYSAMTSHISNDLSHVCDVSFAIERAAKSTAKPIKVTEQPERTKVEQKAVPKLKTKPATWDITDVQEIRVVKITGDKVNVRKGPDLIYKVIGIVNRNEIYQLISIGEQWYQINFNGLVGWVEGSFAVVQ